MRNLKTKYNIVDSEIAYVGDDLIDIPVMEKVGFPIAVANAIQDVKTISIHVTKVAGGFGAFREAVSWLINEQGRMEDILKSMKEKYLIADKYESIYFFLGLFLAVSCVDSKKIELPSSEGL